MKALSIRQPYVYLILAGLKTIEYRSRKTHHRGPLLIHASQRLGSLDGLTDEQLDALPEEVAVGGFLGIVDLVDVTPDEYGGYQYHLANPRKIKPIAAHGRLNIFDVPDSTLPRSVFKLAA